MPTFAGLSRLAVALTLTSLVVASTGCVSSRYQPRAPGRVAQVLRNGDVGYVRDGRFYRRGLFGGGLEHAVAGDAQAEHLARRHRTGLRDGFWMSILGIACAEVAFIYYIVGTDDQQAGRDQDTENSNLALGAAVGCSAVSLWGFYKMADAQVDGIDAVNVFNDNATWREQQPPPQRPAIAWPPR